MLASGKLSVFMSILLSILSTRLPSSEKKQLEIKIPVKNNAISFNMLNPLCHEMFIKISLPVRCLTPPMILGCGDFPENQ